MSGSSIYSDNRSTNPALSVAVGFENANPVDPDAIDWTDDGTCRIRQYLEPDAPPGYSFHLHVLLINTGDESVALPLHIQWAEDAYDYCRYHLYLGYDLGAEWRALPITCEDGITRCTIIVPPGQHRLSCSPTFDGDDLGALCEYVRSHPPFQCEAILTSAQGRPIPCLRGGDPQGQRVVITTRAHPYETAGVYCMAGWLANLAEERREVPAGFDVHLLPCLNPDGVAAGHGGAAPNGVNFGDGLARFDLPDSGAAAVAQYIRNLEPHVYLDMHNYFRLPTTDSFRCPDSRFLDHFARYAPDNSRQQKQWEFRHYTFAEGYLPCWCAKTFGTLALMTEFPWHLRTPSDMKAHGALFFEALIAALRDRPITPTHHPAGIS